MGGAEECLAEWGGPPVEHRRCDLGRSARAEQIRARATLGLDREKALRGRNLSEQLLGLGKREGHVAYLAHSRCVGKLVSHRADCYDCPRSRCAACCSSLPQRADRLVHQRTRPVPDTPPVVTQLPELRFAMVGDTRPANLDDTADYPTDDHHEDLARRRGRVAAPQFAVVDRRLHVREHDGTPSGRRSSISYLGARAAVLRPVYPAMGNHECTGCTASNCGTGSTDGFTANFTDFIDDARAARHDAAVLRRAVRARPTAAGRRSSCSSRRTRGTRRRRAGSTQALVGADDVHVRRAPRGAHATDRARRDPSRDDHRAASAHDADRRPHAHLLATTPASARSSSATAARR